MEKCCAKAKPPFAKAEISLVVSVVFSLALIVCALVAAYLIVIPDRIDGLGMLLFKGELKHIASPRTGMVVSWYKEEGERISAHEKVALMIDHQTDEAIEVAASESGVIAEIIVFGNAFAEKGQTLAIVSHDGDPRQDLQLTGFVSSFEGKRIRPGMIAHINPTITNAYQHGYLEARVKRVGKLPVTKGAILSIIKIPEVADFIRGQIKTEPFVVILEPIKNKASITGYQWTGPGPQYVLDSGVFAELSIVVSNQRLLQRLLPSMYMQADSK